MSSLPRLTPSMQAARGPALQPALVRASLRVPQSRACAASSSFSSSSSSSSSSPPSSTIQTSPSKSPLTWDRYLQLRYNKTRAGFWASLPTTAVAAYASGSYFLTQEVDPTNTFMGFDPIIVSCGLTLVCTGVGWLMGPMVGEKIYSAYHSKQRKAMEDKDRIFYEHIVRRRCDLNGQNMQNRPIDYYGEKIASRNDYRQWLRDQTTFSRKAAHGVKSDMKTL